MHADTALHIWLLAKIPRLWKWVTHQFTLLKRGAESTVYLEDAVMSHVASVRCWEEQRKIKLANSKIVKSISRG